MTSLCYDIWLFLQDGNTKGVSLKSLGSNLRENPIEKLITYKTFMKLIPNLGQEISKKSKLKLLCDWSISGDYYQLYGWTSGQTSQVNMHNFQLDDYPDQDFFGDLILFKVDPTGHHYQQISEEDIINIDLAKREDLDEEEEEEEDDIDPDDDGGDNDEEEEEDPDEIGDDEEEEDEEDNYQYDDDAGEGDDFDDEANLYQDYEDDDAEFDLEDRTSKRKKKVQKVNHCCFSRLVSADILKERVQNESYELLTEKQQKMYDIFRELLFKKKKLTKKNADLLLSLERGIYNWTVRNGQKTGFLCLWDDRLFIRLYERKAISLYQNFSSDFKNHALQKDLLKGTLDPYNVSFMTSEELHPEYHKELREQIKKKEKVQFEKRETVGSTQYKCGRCGQRDVSVTAAQTRSADEGITLFVSCNNCPNEWKMGG